MWRKMFSFRRSRCLPNVLPFRSIGLPNTELIANFDYLLDIKFVLSRRMKPQLYYRGYLFNSDSFKNGRVYWRCKESRRGSCMARVLTTETNLIEKQPQHDHDQHTNATIGKKVITLDECYAYFTVNNVIKSATTSKSETPPSKSHKVRGLEL